MFKVELHTHARSASCDSSFDEKSLPVILKKFGFNGFVISNHYCKRQLVKYGIPNYREVRCSDYIRTRRMECPFEKASLGLTDEQVREYYYKWLGSMKLIMLASEQCGIRCYAGMEYQLDTCEHIAVIGCTVQDFEQELVLPDMSIDYISDYAHRHNAIVIQNHPFRYEGQKIQSRVDGYECVNTKHGMDDVMSESEFNHKTGRLGIFICGCDVHYERDIAKSYTLFKEEPKNERELAQMLRDGSYYNYVLNDLDKPEEGYKVCPL